MKLRSLIVIVLLASQVDAAEIHDLIKSRSAEAAVALIQAKPELLDVKDESECTPLHLAARFGSPALVEFLIARGADLNTRSYNQFTPLHVCESPVLAKLLVRAGARTDLTDAWGNTALQMQSESKREDVCSVLIEGGVAVDIVSALTLKKRDVARALALKNPEILKSHVGTASLWGNRTPLGWAVAADDFELVRFFVSLGAPVEGATFMPQAGGPTTPLCTAILRENLQIATFLLEKEAKVAGAAGKFYPDIIDYAAEHSSKAMKALLARYSRDPRLTGEKRPNK